MHLVRVTEAIKIGVPDFGITGIIGLDQRECGRGNLFFPAQPCLDECPREVGFSRADAAGQKHGIAGPEVACQYSAQSGCIDLAGQKDREGRSAGHGTRFSVLVPARKRGFRRFGGCW